MKKARGLIPLAAATIAALALAGPASAQKVIRHIPDADLKVLDPIFTTIGTTISHGYMIFDMLYAPDSKWVYQPQMAESHTVSADGLTWNFKLRAGLKFHDGSPVEGKDVAQSVKRWMAKNTLGRTLATRIADVKSTGADTFQIVLKEPFAPMLEATGTSSNPLFIMREQEARIDPDVAVTTMIGSGAFTFDPKDWNPGHSVTYRKFKDYRPRNEPADGVAGGKVVKVDAVEWIYIPDANTRVQAVLKGEADTIEVIPPDLLPMLKASPNIEVRVMDKIGNQTMLRPNHLVPPFNNPKVRQALLYAVDQDQYLQVMQSDPSMRSLCWSVFMCGTPLETKAGVNDAWAKPGAKPEMAKKLLQEAGYKNEPIVLMDPTDQPVISALTQISAQLMRQAGFNVDVQTMDWATLVSRRPVKEAPSVNKGGWHVFHTWGTGPFMSSPLMNSGAQTPCDGRNWFGWPCDEVLEKTRLEYLNADTPAKRMEVINRYQNRFYETVPYLPLGQFVGPIAYRKELKGVIPDIRLSFWNVEK
ncbi:MAG: ABC transporter substrate-binding protein [Alphaproteobacteria bacterium]|nr:ABC transporter substrate-binding protein [Alphaproteobacteria bacterium]